MKLKLAKQTLQSKAKEINIEEALEILNTDRVIFLDCSNTKEEISKLVDKLKDKKVYVNTVKYGLLEDEYIYEVHTL
ncbi:HP0268 family nuclease [Campylobacter canadensis]|uniref:HP0268 domain-containing protein n=1 Tax=Campylobacter canadensis TaxID=449520 RepID=A0ABS7WUU2_9BACT|nr:HP0268 family nuclease [Campylobacter canadensis]MBZ7987725.1 hypothetical protein [Campylobacter canadensis]MBZ7994132.1 hypothetical protein [Campylobacter canadensis]MBZ7995865.1 hypothetical protein [Campylobacter canadensis]MBZ7997502.1 hypothetical protein [Campylobacter canadensis]MBZ7999463.1 hypothetical protein [Campylobacter canadensis]